MSVNKVILVGRIAQEIQLRHTTSGKAVATLSLATNENFTNSAGEKVDRATFHRVVVWDRQAENCEKYLSKGRQVFVEGRIQNRQWEDQHGNKRWTTEVVAQSVQFLDARRTQQNASQSTEATVDAELPPEVDNAIEEPQEARQMLSTGDLRF